MGITVNASCCPFVCMDIGPIEDSVSSLESQVLLRIPVFKFAPLLFISVLSI